MISTMLEDVFFPNLKGSLGTASPHLFRPEYKVGSSGGGGEGETQAVLCG